MSDPETRALGRAALLLLVASLARWGWDAAASSPPEPGVQAGPELLERSRALARSEEARSRPLGPDERLDPNTAAEEALDRLPGVGAATARAIVRSREVDGPFRRPEDLARVKGVGAAAVDRLAPHLDFSRTPPATASPRARPREGPVPPRTRPREEPAPPRAPAPERTVPAGAAAPVDLNHASAAALEGLPGIGPALARRIMEARAERPFSSVEDLARVPGIGPATVARLRSRVVVGR